MRSRARRRRISSDDARRALFLTSARRARATYNASRVRVALLLRPYTAGDPDVPANDVFELRLNSNVILKRKSTLFLSMQGLLSKHHQIWHSGCDPESRYVLKDC
jgi:hypothetical protein